MSSGAPSEEALVAGIYVQQARDVTLRAGGDIVAGDKTTIHNYYGPKPLDITKAPYKFLSYYDIGDRDIFFGRDAVIEELLSEIPRHKVLIINGQSGSGKTSLINAGLIPRLAENGYLYVYFRDYTDPLEQLREYFRNHRDFAIADADQLSLLQMLRTIRSQQESLVVVIFDQFERFLINVAPEQRRKFLQQLRECLESDLTADELNLVISLRDDFFGKLLLEAEAIIPTFGTDSHHHNLRTLNRDEARQAIIQPLKNIPKIGFDGKFVDDVLIPHLIGQATNEAKIEPPHLQIVCNQLYEAARERYRQQLEDGEPIRIGFDLYHDLGETEGMLRDYLDDVVRRITNGDPKETDIVRSTLKLMIESVGTRKFESLYEISADLPDVPRAKTENIIQRLQEARVLEAKQSANVTEYSLSHEFMVAKVRSWYDEREMNRRRAEEAIERGLLAWKSTKSVLDEHQLELIEQWLPADSETGGAKELLFESKRRLVRLAWLKRIALVAMITASILMPVAVTYWRIAVSETGKAIRSNKNLSRKVMASQMFAKSLQALERGDATKALRLCERANESDPNDTAISEKLTTILNTRPFYKATLNGHTSAPRLVSLSANGHYLISASHQEMILWNVETDKHNIVFQFKPESINALVVHPTKRQFFLGFRQRYSLSGIVSGGDIGIFDFDGKRLGRIDHRTKNLLVSGDGRHLLAVGEFSPTKLWNLESKEPKEILDLGECDSATFSRDGSLIAYSASESGFITICNLAGERLLSTQNDSGGHKEPVTAIAFSSDCTSLASGSKDQTIKTWRIRIDDHPNAYKVGVLTGHSATISSVEFSANGELLFSTSHDGSAILWRARFESPVQVYKSGAGVTAACWSPEAHSIFVANNTSTIEEYDARGRELLTLSDKQGFDDVSGPKCSAAAIQFNDDGRQLFAAHDYHQVSAWDLQSGKRTTILDLQDVFIGETVFSRDGSVIAVTSKDTVHVVGSDRTILKSFKAHYRSIDGIGIAPGGREICTTGEDRIGNSYRRTVKLWDDKGAAIHTLVDEPSQSSTFSRCISYSPDGRCLVVAVGGHSTDGNHVTGVWNGNRVKIGSLSSETSPIRSVAVSPDGSKILTGNVDGIPKLWTKEGQIITTFSGHQGNVTNVAIAPSGEFVVTAGDDGVVREWSLDGTLVQELEILGTRARALNFRINCLTYAPDGRFIAVGTRDTNHYGVLALYFSRNAFLRSDRIIQLPTEL